MTPGSDGLGFAGWLTSVNGSKAANPYTANANATLYASWKSAEDLRGDAEDMFGGSNLVLGNPNDNIGIAWDIGVVLNLIGRYLDGYTKSVLMETDSGTETVIQTFYDLDAIGDWMRELEKYLGSGRPELDMEVIVQEVRYRYLAPTAANRDPVRIAKVKTAGNYEIELKGASGGHIWTRGHKTAPGGKGGHIMAQYWIDSGVELDLRIGGRGYGSSDYDSKSGRYTQVDYGRGITSYALNSDGDIIMTTYDSMHAGGYNGGGAGGATGVSGYRGGAGGGGATDVRLKDDNSALTGDAASDPRIIAAGGGGSAQQNSQESATGTWEALGGGNAGGAEGDDGKGATNNPKGGTASDGGVQISTNNTAGTPGYGTNGVRGGNGAPEMNEGRGGGGGWWGGGAQTTRSVDVNTGAGGSSYAGGSKPGVNYITTVVNETIPINEYNDGWARIKWLD